MMKKIFILIQQKPHWIMQNIWVKNNVDFVKIATAEMRIFFSIVNHRTFLIIDNKQQNFYNIMNKRRKLGSSDVILLFVKK